MVLHTVTPVPEGPVAYRYELRRRGPWMALVVPMVALAIGGALLSWGGSAVRGLGGFRLTTMAAPTLLLLGVPVSGGVTRYAIAGATSFVLWLALGSWAASRATRVPCASWRDWWRELAWLVIPVWIGAGVAFAVAYLVVI